MASKKPKNGKPRMKLVEDMIARIESAIEGCEEYATDVDNSCLAEFVASFGYNEGEFSFEYIDDEVKETLEALKASNKNWRKLILPFCTVELHDEKYTDNSIFCATIGEQEHQLDDLDRELKEKFTESEQKLVREKTYMKDGGWVYTSHDYERFCLILDVDAFLEKYPPKSIKVYGKLRLIQGGVAS